ncbi:hypothetical protein [Actinopolyspora halophila]|uniref:hypothetical protein n=1 Tax=Actinopolyspora halophila TaxID=1850 RepID=UPI00037C1DBD|nr:hypothetical protein [Actinopolyspora halophila]
MTDNELHEHLWNRVAELLATTGMLYARDRAEVAVFDELDKLELAHDENTVRGWTNRILDSSPTPMPC